MGQAGPLAAFAGGAPAVTAEKIAATSATTTSRGVMSVCFTNSAFLLVAIDSGGHELAAGLERASNMLRWGTAGDRYQGIDAARRPRGTDHLDAARRSRRAQ